MKSRIEPQETVSREPANRLHQLGAQRIGVDPGQRGHGGGDLTHAQLAVGHPGQGGHRGTGLDGSPQPSALTQQDDGGLTRPGNEVALLGDVGGEHRAQGGNSVVEPGEQLPGPQHLSDVWPQDPLTGGGHLLQEAPVPSGALRAVDDEVSEADPLDAARLEVTDPGPQGGVEGLGVTASRHESAP